MTKPTLYVLIHVLLVLAALPSTLWAASPIVDARLTVNLIRFEGQQEVTAAATAAKPGDVLEYTARYANRGTAPAGHLMPTVPVPAGTEYLPSGVSPPPSEASLDGRTFAAIPLRRAVRGPDGVVRDVDVPSGDYRALRWNVGALAVGAETTVRVRMRVSALAPSMP